jgi:hypothetical protein
MAPRIELPTGGVPSYQSGDNNISNNNNRSHPRSNMSSRIYSEDDDDQDDDQNNSIEGERELATPIHSPKREEHQYPTGGSNNDESSGRGLTVAAASTRVNRYSNLGRQRFGTAYHYMVAGSVLIYWLFVSIIPVYNKHYFQKTLYPYPIATAGIQLGFVSLLLALLNSIQHYIYPSCQPPLYRRRRRTGSTGTMMGTARGGSHNNLRSSSSSSLVISDVKVDDVEEEFQHSWIFGPHFWWKVKWCFPIGALFGLKYGCTNLGLHLVPAPTHLLLQSTDLVWTVLGAWWINGEVVSLVEMFCLGMCVVGSVVLGWQLNESTIAAPVFAIVVNLISPMLLGVCLATLRLACTELMRPDNRVGGTVSAVELTAIKLIVSSAVGLALACIMEGGDETRPSWWSAFFELSHSTRWGVLGGAILISVFQVNCTFLTFLTSAVVLGLVGQVKIIPQWILAAFSASRTSNFTIHSMNLVGAFLIMVSAAAFAVSNWLSTSSSTSTHHSCECDVDVIHCECIHPESDDTSHEGDNDEDEEHGDRMARLSTTTIGHHHHHRHSIEGGGDNRNAEGKPLLMLGDANEWGAAYLRKNYSAMDNINDDSDSQEIIIGCGGGPIHSEREPIIIPLLTTTTATTTSSSS